MKIDNYIKPHSSFLSMEKDTSIIVNEMLNSPRLVKLLKYTTPDALTQPALTRDEATELVGTNIKLVPKLYVDSSVLQYVIITFDNFTPNLNNPEFRDNIVEFDIICHFDQWQLKDFQLRPYRIAAEIDTLFNEKHLTGIGILNFIGASQIILTDEFAGVCLLYRAVHGEDDEHRMLNPEDEKRLQAEYYESNLY